MIDPSKLTHRRMTKEDLSLLFLSVDVLEFKSTEQFENWLFVLNFPLIAPYIKVLSRTDISVRVGFDLPFDFAFTTIDDTNIGKCGYHTQPDPSDFTKKTMRSMAVNMHYPEARLLIKAGRS